MPYADYKYYTETYRGKLTEEEFDRFSVKTSAYLERITSDRIKENTEEEGRLAACSVTDELAKQEEPELTSQTVGPWRKEYAPSEKSGERRLYDAAALYLAGTGLLYRGL